MSFVLLSQESTANSIVISGKVLDSISQEPIEFATVSFQNKKDIVGTTTDNKGNFKMHITPGIYTIKIQFLSYEPQEFAQRSLKSNTNLGAVQLYYHIENLDEINIIAEKKLVEFKIDRKIYNASRDISNKGGNAIDVLNNTPSVRVDDEHNVIMRGANATVLIDGKPILGLDSGLSILNTIPSNTIDKVEIITRSAKYSAEGGGGIINIVTKKRKGTGLNGSLDLNSGSPDLYGASIFLNENTDNINIFSTISFKSEEKIKRATIDQTYYDNSNNIDGFFEQIRKDENQRNSFLFNIGSDFYINNDNTLTTSFLVNTNNKNFISKLNYNDFDPFNSVLRTSQRNVEDLDDISRIEVFLNYTSKFNKEGHQLSFDFKFDNTISENEADITEDIVFPDSETFYQKVMKEQNFDNFMFQLDYELPLNESNKIELGYKSTFRTYKNDFNVNQFDTTLLDFITVDGFKDVIKYYENIHAFYGQYGASLGDFSYSFGLRSEISDITVRNDSSNNDIQKNYSDIFPSASFGYEFEDGAYVSVNYSRSIDRPQVSQLNPFISLSNNRFQSVGNPYLNPFYTNYFELLYDKSFDKVNITSALFLNYAKDQFLTVIENIGQNNEGLEIFRRMPINSGDKKIIGADLDLTYRPTKGLMLRTYVSPYKLDITNTLNNLYDYDSWVWYAEASALVLLNNGLRLQTNYYHQSPITDGLTKLRTINYANISASKDLFQKKASITFKIIDVFNSKYFSIKSLEANTNTFRKVRFDQQFSLSFTYRFNQKRRSSRDRSSDLTKDVLEDKQDEKL